jgi:hypothetical protein
MCEHGESELETRSPEPNKYEYHQTAEIENQIKMGIGVSMIF